MKNYAIILASGTGTRYQSELPKQFAKVAGKTVLEHTLTVFEKSNHIDEIIVVITPQYRHLGEEILLKNNFSKVSKLLNGGETRKDSSYIGVHSITDPDANVLIHDCARPFVTDQIISDCIAALKHHDAIDVAISATDTIIETENDIITNIPNRAKLMCGQTPQGFKLSLIKKAHEIAKDTSGFTDDCGLILKYGLSDVYVVKGDHDNIKITYPSDIFLADKLFQTKHSAISTPKDLGALKNKVIVLFGGTSGIGEHMTKLANSYGAKTYVASRRNGTDITSYPTIEKYLNDIYAKEKHIDYVVNSAGVLRIGKLTDRKIDDILEEININYIGSINVAKAAIPYLLKSNGGLLFFTSSSYTRGRSLYSTYSSAKAAIVNLTQALAEELDGKVRVNAINPERTATPMRLNAFGYEHPDTLLSAEKAAYISLQTLIATLSGQVIDVRR
ncbi:MAG: 2-C-methyl-D-erythritol 4-phosphate cytidylyltransferase [Alphaproteobacteria bacterium]